MSEHVPPPRPKREAAHGYPQKAPKNSTVVSQVAGPFQSSSALLNSALSSWNYNSVPPVSVSQLTKDDAALAGPCIVHNSCYSSSNKITSGTWLFSETIDGGGHGNKSRAMPDFAEVYSFIGSVFDLSASGHLQKLKQLDPINFETALLLMRNLCVNLTSPEFEDHVIIKSNAGEPEDVKLGSSYNINLAHISANTSPSA
ncbi:hypothetical protein E1A91_A12G116100v1 [Gossypium mustelinum]|uniref:Uncharacterized protein n=1 Tax=Gossypium mustelinum TaxID=34275 RepID=A0A5D2WUR9_GOSMU|nr:hypothetical protein E1A91_A12G116100v1 [Gossypium mustelinum]